VFTARYALSPYIKQIGFVFKGLIFLHMVSASPLRSVRNRSDSKAVSVAWSLYTLIPLGCVLLRGGFNSLMQVYERPGIDMQTMLLCLLQLQAKVTRQPKHITNKSYLDYKRCWKCFPLLHMQSGHFLEKLIHTLEFFLGNRIKLPESTVSF
jgi:hypothetical protein